MAAINVKENINVNVGVKPNISVEMNTNKLQDGYLKKSEYVPGITPEKADAKYATQDQFNQLSKTKVDGNHVWNITNMGQDVKEAMTGGSVAVVGVDSVDTINIKDNSVTPSKLKTIIQEDYTSQYNLQSGAIDAGGGVTVNSARARSVNAIKLQKGAKIKIIDSNYLINVALFSGATINYDNFISTPNTYVTEYEVKNEVYFGFTIKNVGNSTIDVSTIVLSDILNIAVNDFLLLGTKNLQDNIVTKQKLGNDVLEMFGKGNYVHMSFDDVSFCITNLLNNKSVFTSIFNEPFIAKLKYFHDKYGAVFSLYVMGTELAQLGDTFKKDFIKNSHWLKLGLHSWSNSDYANTTSEQAKNDWDNFITSAYTATGGVNSIDRMPRLHKFVGNLDSLRAMRDTSCGAIGFLSTDDSRNTYYMTENQNTYLRTHDKYVDTANGLIFYSTDMRLDWFVDGFTSDYNYDTPIMSTPYDELKYRYGTPLMADKYTSLIVFTHEWQIYSSSYVLNDLMVKMVEQVCSFALDYGYNFDYPQNREHGGIISLAIV